MKTRILSFKKTIFIACAFTLVILFIYQRQIYLKEYHIRDIEELKSIETPNVKQNIELLTSKSQRSQPKLACLILTAEKNVVTRAPAVWDTWASGCTSAVFACNCSNIGKLQALNNTKNISTNFSQFEPVKHLPFMQLKLIEDYNKMAEKALLVIRMAFERFYDDHDWFFMADDDTFVFIENMFRFIEEKDTKEPLTYGYNFKVILKNGYHSGGGGILFTKESLKRLHEKIINHQCDYTEGYSDVAIGQCMENAQVLMGNSLDEKGRERFHCLSFEHHYHGFFPDWLLQYASNMPKKGKECCSRYSVTFHYTAPNEMLDYKNKFDFSLLA